MNLQFDDAAKFSEGLAPVLIDKKWGYINKKGEYKIQPQFDKAHVFEEGLAAVMIEKKWGYVDKKGKYVINPQYSEAGDFWGGLAMVNASTYIDKNGKSVWSAPATKPAGDSTAPVKPAPNKADPLADHP